MESLNFVCKKKHYTHTDMILVKTNNDTLVSKLKQISS